MSAHRIAFLLPHFRAGGAERVVLNWVGALDRSRFKPLLVLGRVEGAFLDLLPPDVQPIVLGGRALTRPARIARLLREEEVSLAYAATNAMNLALLAAPTTTLRIVSEHTPPGAYLDEAKWRWLRQAAMRRLYPRADAIAVPTAPIATELAALLGGGPQPTVLPNPVIEAVPHTLPRRALAGPPLRIVAAGRLVPAKGFDLLVDACARLRDRGHDVHATIHGEGAGHVALARSIAAAGLCDRVVLAGHADPLAASLAAADLCVVPSRREGFGNVAIEAMAVGTPVLATRSGGPESFIRDRVNGFLAPAGDAEALADAIAGLAEKPARLDAVCEAGLETARGFTVAAATRRFEALLDSLLPRSTPV